MQNSAGTLKFGSFALNSDAFVLPGTVRPSASSPLHSTGLQLPIVRFSTARMNMPVRPHLDDFQKLAENYELVPVYRRLLSDSLTPVSAFALVDDGRSAACLFESVIGGEKVGRYSFIAVGPRGRIAATRSTLSVSLGQVESTSQVADPLDSLWQAVAGKRVAVLPELPPLTGGAIGYAGYDVVRYVEDLPNVPPDDRQLPDLDFSFFDDLIIFDNVTKTLFVVAHVHVGDFATPQQAYADGVDALGCPDCKIATAEQELAGHGF